MELKQLGDRLVRFVGGKSGMWRVLTIRPVQGDVLPQPERIAVCRGDESSPLESQWTLSGVISNIRYVERPEQQELTLKQAPLGRSEATMAALNGGAHSYSENSGLVEPSPRRTSKHFRKKIPSHRRRRKVFTVHRPAALSWS